MDWRFKVKRQLYCKQCGKVLTGRQKVYCCKKCFGDSKRTLPSRAICKFCGEEFNVKSYKQEYCSKSCSSQREKNKIPKDENRPFTSDTAFFIRKWHRDGDSKERIALALGRSLENIEQAFV